MLTQAEIDALLSGAIEMEEPNQEKSVNLAQIIGSPETPVVDEDEEMRQMESRNKEAGAVRPYNFWSPDRFSKEQMRAVELVHEELAERLTASLPSFLRTNLRPRVVHTEQGRFHDFLKDLPAGTLFHLMVLAPLPGQTILTISPDINAIILEQRLGGKGERRQTNRGLTEIDQLLLRGLAEHMLNDIKAAWAKVVNIEPRLEDSTVNQHWVQMTMGHERVMLITFEMSLPDFTGTMNIYIPFTSLKPIANVLNPHVWISGTRDHSADTEARKAAMESLAKVNVPVRIILGRSELALGEVANLQVGDVIELPTLITQDLPVEIVDRTRFLAKIGRIGKNLAAQIVMPVAPAEKDNGKDLPKKRS